MITVKIMKIFSRFAVVLLVFSAFGCGRIENCEEEFEGEGAELCAQLIGKNMESFDVLCLKCESSKIEMFLNGKKVRDPIGNSHRFLKIIKSSKQFQSGGDQNSILKRGVTSYVEGSINGNEIFIDLSKRNAEELFQKLENFILEL